MKSSYTEEETVEAHERFGVKEFVEDHPPPIGRKPHLRVGGYAYNGLCDELIIKVADSEWKPNQLIGIMCGGGQPARRMALALGIPLAFHGAESYRSDTSGDQRKMAVADDILFSRDLLKTHPGFGTRPLVIDDLTDSGRTFRRTIEWLLEWLRRNPQYGPIEGIKTACLWYKAGSAFMPDYFVDTVVGRPVSGIEGLVSPWIDQPDEDMYASINRVRARVCKNNA